jgi:hypothetical protein
VSWHHSANIVAKVPKANQNEVKKDFCQIFNDIDAAPGEAAIAGATGRAQDFERKYQAFTRARSSALVKDFESLTTPHPTSRSSIASASATPNFSSGPSVRRAGGPR